MARVKMSALVSDIRGRVDDHVFSFQKGTHYYKSYCATPADPQTPRQLQIREAMATLSAGWEERSPVEQSLWQGYAGMTGKLYCGRGAYISLNMHLILASHAALSCVSTPPHIPETPRFPYGLSVFPMSPTSMCITWERPSLITNYITGWFRLHQGFCGRFPAYGCCAGDGYRPHWQFIETVRSDAGHIILNHSWPSGARLYFRCRSTDTWGRVSPYTHQALVYVP